MRLEEEAVMGTYVSRVYQPATPSLARWIVVGAFAGAASVLIFHQGLLALLHALDLTGRIPYSMRPTEPFGVPQIWSLVFWGGVWGAVFAAMLTRFDGARLVTVSTLLGAALPTLVAWFVVAPLKGQPLAAGFEPLLMAAGFVLNGAWGFGTGLGLVLLGGRRIERRHAMTDRRRVTRRGHLQPDAV
jgi:hypothetical protein